jgi:hypothetical protein
MDFVERGKNRAKIKDGKRKGKKGKKNKGEGEMKVS